MLRPASLAAQQPAWLQVWLALLPVLPFLSLAALWGLRNLRHLGLWGKIVLGVYALAQFTAALLTIHPLVALGTGTIRTVLLFGLIGLGISLRHLGVLKLLLYGLGVVLITSAVTSAAWLGSSVLTFRLAHPYYTSISLGIGAAFVLWLVVLVSGDRRWRVAIGAVALVALLLSGSRGAMIMAFIGIAAGSILLARRWAVYATLATIVGALLTVAVLPNIPTVNRLASVDATSRDVIWNDVLSVIREYPSGGVGPYLLGSHLTPLEAGCHLWDALEAQGITCPSWLETIGNPWLIAHNGALQTLAESGWVGAFGLYLVIGMAVYRAVRTRQALAAAILLGLLSGNLTDNVTLVPSPFFAEVFWITAGFALRGTERHDLTDGAFIGAAILTITAFPLFASFLPSSSQSVRVIAISAARTWRVDERYAFQARLGLPPGTYRVLIRSCTLTCVTTTVRAVSSPVEGTSEIDMWLGLPLRQTDIQKVELRVLRGEGPPWVVTPLAVRSWDVRRLP